MEIINTELSRIKPYEYNPRNNDEAVEYVANSIKEFGFKNPIILDSDGAIIAGHTRYKAAQKLGLEKVPCVYADDLTEEQAAAFRLADNKTAEFAKWDFEMLMNELDEITIDMADFGFEDEFTCTAGDFDEDFSLPDGDKSEYKHMSFNLHEKQAELIEYAMGIVKDDIEETFGNPNKNGNALYEVIRQWAELRKSN